jgi:hypothetical protein
MNDKVNHPDKSLACLSKSEQVLGLLIEAGTLSAELQRTLKFSGNAELMRIDDFSVLKMLISLATAYARNVADTIYDIRVKVKED